MDRDIIESCFSNHMGLWAVEPIWFMQAVSMFKAGLWPAIALSDVRIEAAEREKRPYQMAEDVAIISMHGPMSKGGSPKLGGSSTVYTQRAIRMAARDEGVKALLLDIDSPGGHVSGVQDLADEIARVRQSKVVGAQISDLGASAAYWAASQADFIAANSTAEIGSIGTILALEDSSKRMERLGIEVRVLSTAPYKGIGIDGVAISNEAMAYLQNRVEAINAHFLGSVQRGRGLNAAELGLISDGRVHLADTAKSLKLIDHVQSFDDTLYMLRNTGTTPHRLRAMQAEGEALPALPIAGDRSHCEQAVDAPLGQRLQHPRHTLLAYRQRTGV